MCPFVPIVVQKIHHGELRETQRIREEIRQLCCKIYFKKRAQMIFE